MSPGPISIGDKHFLARHMLFFSVQWEIFNKQESQGLG